MKMLTNILTVDTVFFFSYSSYAGLIAISCQDNIGFTLTADKKEGTLSDSDGSAIGVFNMTQIKKDVYKVDYPMIETVVTIKETGSEDGFKIYKVTRVRKFDGKTTTDGYNKCSSYQALSK